MSRYFCHEYPEVLVVETRVIAARPGAVLLEQSPFHPGGGGQLADRGVLRWSGGEARVTGIEAEAGRYWHLIGEPVEISGAVQAAVDPSFRSMMATVWPAASTAWARPDPTPARRAPCRRLPGRRSRCAA